MERRMFLALGAAAVGLAGCTPEPSEPGPPSGPPSPVTPSDPDGPLRNRVAEAEGALIAAYRSAIAADPGLAADLAPFLAHHEAHMARIAPGFVPSAGPPEAAQSPLPPMSSDAPSPGAPSASGAAPSSPASPGVPVDGGARQALSGLAAAESAAQVQRTTACDGAQDPALARDLCLIAASEAQHAAALADLAAQGVEP